MIDVKNFTCRGGGQEGGQAAARGRYPFRKMRKSQEQYQYYDQIWNKFLFRFFFYDEYYKISWPKEFLRAIFFPFFFIISSVK